MTRDGLSDRLTLWRAGDFDAAIILAEEEASEYAAVLEEGKYVGIAQAYHLTEEPAHGAEVFSLIRESELAPAPYLDTFFDTGRERQSQLSGDPGDN